MAELWRSGIGGILDYAAEDDVSEEGGPASRGEEHSTVVARTFDYADEEKCDAHMRIFLQSIAAAEQSEGQGFAAIKVRCHFQAHWDSYMPFQGLPSQLLCRTVLLQSYTSACLVSRGCYEASGPSPRLAQLGPPAWT